VVLKSNSRRYFIQPNFALTSTQSFLLSAESTIRRPANNETEIIQFNLRDAKGPPLTSPLPDAQKSFVLYTVVQVLAHQNSIPKGFINHTTWEPQSLPLVALDRMSWNSHQLVSWTGPKPIWIELTINNIDGTGHPFHLVCSPICTIQKFLTKNDHHNSTASISTSSPLTKARGAGTTTTHLIRQRLHVVDHSTLLIRLVKILFMYLRMDMWLSDF
jgi:hypothetical protein